MGNALSEEEQEQILEEAYNLEDPEADKYLNAGTAAPSCQPKHTQKELMNETLMVQEGGQDGGSGVGSNGDGSEDGDKALSAKHRRGSSVSEANDQEERRKRQHTTAVQQEQEMEAAQQQKKLSYFQMARLGYQELVNAIIRPPRADYKVRVVLREEDDFCSAAFRPRIPVFVAEATFY
jgi:hypothetical protein